MPGIFSVSTARATLLCGASCPGGVPLRVAQRAHLAVAPPRPACRGPPVRPHTHTRDRTCGRSETRGTTPRRCVLRNTHARAGLASVSCSRAADPAAHARSGRDLRPIRNPGGTTPRCCVLRNTHARGGLASVSCSLVVANTHVPPPGPGADPARVAAALPARRQSAAPLRVAQRRHGRRAPSRGSGLADPGPGSATATRNGPPVLALTRAGGARGWPGPSPGPLAPSPALLPHPTALLRVSQRRRQEVPAPPAERPPRPTPAGPVAPSPEAPR